MNTLPKTIMRNDHPDTSHAKRMIATERAALTSGSNFAVVASLSCITTGMHTLVDVVAGFLVYLLVANGAWVVERIRRLVERIANSWTEVQWGGVRFINHGLWAALGTFEQNLPAESA